MKTRTLAWIVLLFSASAEVASAQSAKRPPRKGRAYAVTIYSAPQQATIYLDGKEYGTVGYTPYTGRLVGGDYKLILEVPGYKPLERTISVGAQKHDHSAREFLGASAGALFGKAGQLSDEVHQAMTARGYRGNARTLASPRPGALDAVYAAAALLAAVLLVWGDHALRG